MADQEFKEFPKWKYRGNESVIVNNPVEEDDLEGDWGNEPGYMPEPPIVDPPASGGKPVSQPVGNLDKPEK